MKKLNWTKGRGLIPAVVQDARTARVLMVGWMNRQALAKTRDGGLVTFFSRSKNRLWTKGETSGHIQIVKRVFFDCEGNSLVFMVEQHVAACHAGYKTCYYREYIPKTDSIQIVESKVFEPDNVYK